MNNYGVLRVASGSKSRDFDYSNETLISFQAENEDQALLAFGSRLVRWGITPDDQFRLYREEGLNLVFVKQFKVISKGVDFIFL